MEKRPTKKQKELLSFIDGFIKGNGYGPSYREIMRALPRAAIDYVADAAVFPYGELEPDVLVRDGVPPRPSQPAKPAGRFLDRAS